MVGFVMAVDGEEDEEVALRFLPRLSPLGELESPEEPELPPAVAPRAPSEESFEGIGSGTFVFASSASTSSRETDVSSLDSSVFWEFSSLDGAGSGGSDGFSFRRAVVAEKLRRVEGMAFELRGIRHPDEVVLERLYIRVEGRWVV